jgi:hypothetical protein
MAITFKSKTNNAAGRLDSVLTAGATTLNLKSGEGALFPSSNFRMTLFDVDPDIAREIVLCSSRTGDACTVTRAQEGTSDVLWPIESNVKLMDTVLDWTDLEDGVNGIISGSQTLDSIDVSGNADIGGNLTADGGAHSFGESGVADATVDIYGDASAPGQLNLRGATGGTDGGSLALFGATGLTDWTFLNSNSDVKLRCSDSDRTFLIENIGAGVINMDIDGDIDVGVDLTVTGDIFADTDIEIAGDMIQDAGSLIRAVNANNVLQLDASGNSAWSTRGSTFLNIDSDNNATDRRFEIKHGAATAGGGTSIATFREDGDNQIAEDLTIGGALNIIGNYDSAAGNITLDTGDLDVSSGTATFNNFSIAGGTPTKETGVSGSRGGNAALLSLLTALENYGLIIDNTTA